MKGTHTGRFQSAFAVLAGIAVAALVIAVVLLAQSSSPDARGPWSTWSPQDGGTSGEREIADHLAPLYRISGTDQLAVVTVSDLASGTSAPASRTAQATGASSTNALQVAVRTNARQNAISLLPGRTVAFNLCGLGSSDCSIGVGAPSTDRLLLLRREALELALYTFRYINQTDNVVALLPPSHAQPQATGTLTPRPPVSSQSPTSNTPVRLALLFVRDELKPFLVPPLDQTLPLPYPPQLSQMKLWKPSQEAALVEQITAHGIFQQHLSQTQDGSNLIVLDQLPPQ